MSVLTPANLIWLAMYLLLVGGLVGGTYAARDWALTTFSTPREQAAWERWGQEARRQAAGEGPVQRRVPRSAEPPLLVLMRDHFATCLLGSWLFTTALFVTLMVLLRGALRSPHPIDLSQEAEEQS